MNREASVESPGIIFCVHKFNAKLGRCDSLAVSKGDIERNVSRKTNSIAVLFDIAKPVLRKTVPERSTKRGREFRRDEGLPEDEEREARV